MFLLEHASPHTEKDACLHLLEEIYSWQKKMKIHLVYKESAYYPQWYRNTERVSVMPKQESSSMSEKKGGPVKLWLNGQWLNMDK